MGNKKTSKLAALAPPSVNRGPRCGVARLTSKYPDEVDALVAMLDDRDAWAGTSISKAIRNELSEDVSPSVIQRHRNGECMCHRVAQ